MQTNPSIEGLILRYGSHPTPEAGMCAMEAVAWLAGEPHSDSPACADPGIASIMQRLNDRMPTDAMRTELLLPLLLGLIGSRTDSREVRQKRAFIAADMACRVFAPIALEARGRLDLATELRSLTEVTDRGTAIEARDKCRSAAVAAAAAYAYNAAAYAAADAAYAAADAADAATAAYAYNAAADAVDADATAATTAATAADAAAVAAYADAVDADATADAAGAAYAAAKAVFVEAVRMVTRMLDVRP